MECAEYLGGLRVKYESSMANARLQGTPAVIQDCQSRAFFLRAKKSQYQNQPIYRKNPSPSSSPLNIEITYKREGGQEFRNDRIGHDAHTHVISQFGQPRIRLDLVISFLL